MRPETPLSRCPRAAAALVASAVAVLVTLAGATPALAAPSERAAANGEQQPGDRAHGESAGEGAGEGAGEVLPQRAAPRATLRRGAGGKRPAEGSGGSEGSSGSGGQQAVASDGTTVTVVPGTTGAPRSTWQVEYTGFSTEAKAAFQRAVDRWAAIVASPVPIKVRASFSPLPSGVLGSAGASTYYGLSDGSGTSYYPSALADVMRGEDLGARSGVTSDITAEFSSTMGGIHYGTDLPRAGQVDFTTVVMHELGHGLGFTGGVYDDAGVARYYNPAFRYDRFPVTGSGTPVLSLASGSAPLEGAVAGGPLYWDGPQAKATLGGARPRLYAPTTWESGSSYAHLDEATFPQGTAHSLMTPALSPQEVVQTPGAVAVAVLRDLGWTASLPVPPSVPAAPGGVTAAAGDAQLTATWTAPADGGSAITSYRAMTSPGGRSCTTTGARSCTVTGLANGTAYTVSVTATNAVGTGPASAPSGAVRPIAPAPAPTSEPAPAPTSPSTAGGSAPSATEAAGYTPLSPARLLDTRPGAATVDGTAAGGGAVAADATRTLQVTGRGGVPASGVAAVVLNVTATAASAASYLTVFPAGETRPTSSSLNFRAGQTVPNNVVAKVGDGGQVSVYNAAGSVHVLADVAGWFAGGGQYTPLSPARLQDTRPGQPTVDGAAAGGGAVGPGDTRLLQVAGRGGVPASGAGAVVLTVTATAPTASSYLTAFPAGEARPGSSDLNVVAGQTVANTVVAKVGSGGQVSVYNASGSTHVVVDVAGWFPLAGQYVPLVPARVQDTRPGLPTVDGLAAGGGSVGPGETRVLRVTGRGGVPVSGVSAVVLNVTATGPSAASYLTVFPAGETRPNSSSLNLVAGRTVANNVVAKVGSGGQVSVYNASGSSHVLVDVAGWFAS